MAWFEAEEFWREFFTVLFPPWRSSEAQLQVNQIITLTGFQGESVLDLCCGPGYHAAAFARRGFKVTGVDLSGYLLDLARDETSKLGFAIKWIREDMRNFCAMEAFDLVCNLTTSIGYFDDEADNLSVLRNVYASLRPGGIFLIDTTGKEIIARKWQAAFCTENADGSTLIRHCRIRDDWSRIHNEWILLKDTDVRKFSYEHHIYSGSELKEKLLQSGFGRVQLYGDLEGSPYGLEAARLIAIAKK